MSVTKVPAQKRRRDLPKNALLGYARVSTGGQDLTRQLRALKAARCDRIWQDVASGKSLKGRPQLDDLLEALASGDSLVIAEWDRATRSYADGLEILRRVIEAKAEVKVLDHPALNIGGPFGQALLGLFSALAEMERDRIKKRTSEGRALAKAKGVVMGRRPKLTDHQRREALRMVRDEQKSLRDVAKHFNVSHMAIARLT
jgi:DNA invertase Pin-like site-specific DNA recombinase